jgi:hypothetical protein
MGINNFLLEWYYKEDERKYALDNSLNIPIGILTAFVAGIYYLVTKYNYEDENVYLKIAFIIFISLAVIFWFISIFYILLSYNDLYKGYTYDYLPCTDFVKKEEENLKEYYETNKTYFLENNITFEKLLEENVNNLISNCINTNMFHNDRKANYLYRSKKHLINCIVIIFLTGIFFSINYIQHEKQEIYNIKIMNQQRAATQQTPPPPPPRPQEPRRVKQSEPPKERPTPPKNPQR